MQGKLLTAILLAVLSACSSTKNVSLKHSNPAMVQPARFEQELADCRAWAEGASSEDGSEGEFETLPKNVSDYAVSLCLRNKGYVQVDSDGQPTNELPQTPGLAMQWYRAGTHESTYYSDSRECRSITEPTVLASKPDNFSEYYNSFVTKFSFCMRGRGYQCRGSDCQ